MAIIGGTSSGSVCIAIANGRCQNSSIRAMNFILTIMSLQSLERPLCIAILPSCIHRLALYESQMKEDVFQYMDVMPGGLT